MYGVIDCDIAEQASYSMHMTWQGSLNMWVHLGRKDAYKMHGKPTAQQEGVLCSFVSVSSIDHLPFAG